LAPEYKKLATNLKGMINVVAIDCDAENGKRLAAQYGIQGTLPSHYKFKG